MELVKLSTLANGAVSERFEDALAEMIENIQDVNTEPTLKRAITLTLTISPDDKRDYGMVEVAVKTRLAPLKSVGTVFHMGIQNGHAVVYENNPKQPGLFDSEEKPPAQLREVKKYAAE